MGRTTKIQLILILAVSLVYTVIFIQSANALTASQKNSLSKCNNEAKRLGGKDATRGLKTCKILEKSHESGEFKILGVVFASSVKANGKKKNNTIIYQGSPRFPVFVTIYPKRCPHGCTVGDFTYQIPFTYFYNPVQPIIFKNSSYCIGQFGRNIPMDYEIQLKDVTGLETKPFHTPFTCKP